MKQQALIHDNTAINKHPQKNNKTERDRDKEDNKRDVIARHCFSIKPAVPVLR